MADTFARMKQLVGTTAEWAANDIVLGEGEIGVERIGVSDHRAKCGDGVKTWSQLPYLSGTAAAVDAQVAAASAHAATATTQAGIATTKASEASASQSAAAASQSAAAASEANAANSAASALDSAANAAATAGFRDFSTLASLQANTTLTYSGATANTVQVGQIIRLRDTGFAYQVVASNAAYHIATSNATPVRLISLPGVNGYNVKAFGAKGDGTTNDSAAIQTAIDYAISTGVRSVYFPFGGRERYRLSSTITIASSGFSLIGNLAPIYEPENGGYIFGDAGVANLFDYGNGSSSFASNQFVVEGLGFYSNTSPALTQNAIKFSQNNNGPHRGTLLRKCCAKGFANVFLADCPTVTNIVTANVVVENCVFRGNTNAVSSIERSFGLRFVGNQSEQGARISGNWEGGVTIADNMLEGQGNPINIEAFTPSVVIENNYFEACDQDYLVRFRGTTKNAQLDIRSNYISRVYSVDMYRIEFLARVFEGNLVNNTNFIAAAGANPEQKARKALITGLGAFFVPGSNLSGRIYTGVSSGEFAAGYTNPQRLAGILPSTAVVSKNLGTVSMQTPFGATTTGVTVTGFPATYYPTPSSTPALLTKSWSAGDVLVACALVRVEDGTQPYFSIYNQAYADTDVRCSQINIDQVCDGEWYLMFAVRSTTVAGTGCRFRFGSNGVLTSTKNIHVAAVGIDVIPAADFVTLGTGSTTASRAFARLFNPFV